MRKKVKKIKDDIVLSIKYARLQEEVVNAETKKRDLAEKKKIIGTNDKKIEETNKFIEDVNKAISKIEQSNSRAAYSLIVDNNLGKQLNILSKNKNYELMIKYGIAIEIVLDDAFEYTDNTNKNFLEKISLKLFNDKSVIEKMEENYKKISTCIYGTSIKNHLDETTKLISKLPIKDLANVAIFIPKQVVAVAGTAVFGIGLGLTHLKLKKQAKQLSTLSPGDLANNLILNAMNLLYAHNYFKNEMEYRNYFKNILKVVNYDRKIIMKEMFEEQFETEKNKLKIKLLHNFDDYLIEQMNLKNKKKRKQNV